MMPTKLVQMRRIVDFLGALGRMLALLMLLMLLPLWSKAAFAQVSSTDIAKPEARQLRIYNWSGYIADSTVADFEREFGIKVQYDKFDNNEILHAKLQAGKTGYDLVVPSLHFAQQQANAGLLQKLDKKKLPNLRYLDPQVQALLAAQDPGNTYMVNWLFGFTTVGINTALVKNALGDLPMPDNVWELLFNPQYLSRLQRCGVSLLDSATEVLPAALHYLGKFAYSNDAQDYAALAPLLTSIRPYIRLFSSSGYVRDLAAGKLCVVLGWNGDINQARETALNSRDKQDIKALLPKTGGLLFFDVMVIPADAPHANHAHTFINYLLRPEVQAALTNQLHYASPNLQARRHVLPERLANPTVTLPAAEWERMVAPGLPNAETRRLMTNLYSRFKMGL